ncbi:Uncharacterised protein [Mycobacteroides abscessus]|nr:Uncharacterised protein [Mycobacteroides abscessus]
MSAPVAFFDAAYSIIPSTTRAVPLPAGVAMPVTWTESPSGSMPSSGTAMRTLDPDSTRASISRGCGGALSSPSRIRIVTWAESSCPLTSRTR